MNSPGRRPSISLAPILIHQNWIWFKAAETNDKWQVVFCCLRGNLLCLHSSDDTTVVTLISKLPLTQGCSFHCTKGKEGFNFELHVGRHKKRFRVKEAYEREHWRACIEGVITGSVPKNVIISPQDAEQIAERLSQCFQDNAPHRHSGLQSSSTLDSDPSYLPPTVPSGPGPRGSISYLRQTPSEDGETVPSGPGPRGSISHLRQTPSEDGETGSLSSGGSLSLRSQQSTGTKPSQASGSGSGSSPRHTRHSSGSEDSGKFTQYGPKQQGHLFSMTDNETVPPWFFENVSHEQADKILEKCPEKGNTLMRVSFQRDTDYAISCRKSGVTSHYAVVRVSGGYMIRVDNCKSALPTLSDAMAFFRKEAGEATTYLLTTNCLEVLLGPNHSADYSGRIIPSAEFSPAKSNHDSDSGGSAMQCLDAVINQEAEAGPPKTAGAAQGRQATVPRQSSQPAQCAMIDELRQKQAQRVSHGEQQSDVYQNDDQMYEVLDYYQNLP